MKNRAGGYRKNLSGEVIYQSFIPSPLPPVPSVKADSEMLSLVVEAERHLAALYVISKNIPNMDMFVSMYVRKEALMSSQIEGTQATLEDILDPALEKNANRDVIDVVNYIRATEYAVKRLESLPLCCRLIRETHAVLMENVPQGILSSASYIEAEFTLCADRRRIRESLGIPRTGSEQPEAQSGRPDTFLPVRRIWKQPCLILKSISMMTMMTQIFLSGQRSSIISLRQFIHSRTATAVWEDY